MWYPLVSQLLLNLAPAVFDLKSDDRPAQFGGCVAGIVADGEVLVAAGREGLAVHNGKIDVFQFLRFGGQFCQVNTLRNQREHYSSLQKPRVADAYAAVFG